MSRFRLFGIAGKAYTGKDTLGLLFGEVGYVTLAFAHPIKQIFAALLGVQAPELDALDKEAMRTELGGKSLREAYQTLGTDWGRNMIWDGMWIHQAAMQCHRVKQSGHRPGVVFTDVRFNNEADWIREEGGQIIHLAKPHARTARPHESEQGVRFVRGDKLVLNNGTQQDLAKELYEILSAKGGNTQ